MIPMPLDQYAPERRNLWTAVLLQVVQDANQILLDHDYGKQLDMFETERPNGLPTRRDCWEAIKWIVGRTEARTCDRDTVCEFLGKDGDDFRRSCIECYRSNGNLNAIINNLNEYLNNNKIYKSNLIE